VAGWRSLMRDRTATTNRLKTLTIELLKRHAHHRLRQIETQVASLDDAIDALVTNDPQLSRRRALLASIPGLAWSQPMRCLPICRNSARWKKVRPQH
jgi:transposase